LKPKCDESLSNFAFNCNLRHYTVAWLLSADGGDGAAPGGKSAAMRRRALALIGVCWLVTVIPALEMEMWLPWGLANPCVVAVTHLRLPVSLAGVAVAVLVEGSGAKADHMMGRLSGGGSGGGGFRGGSGASSSPMNKLHGGGGHGGGHSGGGSAGGNGVLFSVAAGLGGTVCALAAFVLLAVGPSASFPRKLSAFAAWWFSYGGLLPVSAALVGCVGLGRDVVLCSPPVRALGSLAAGPHTSLLFSLT